jgi:hypothetical protein
MNRLSIGTSSRPDGLRFSRYHRARLHFDYRGGRIDFERCPHSKQPKRMMNPQLKLSLL